jgi:hypothetical protein
MYVLKPLALGVLLALVSATTGAHPPEERKSSVFMTFGFLVLPLFC